MSQNACGVESTNGTTFERQNPTSDVWETVGAIESLPEPNETAETAECNDAYAGTTGWKQRYKTGVFDGGTRTVVINWKSGDPVQDALLEDFHSLDPRNYRVVYPDANLTKNTYAANVKSFSKPSPGNGGKFTRSFELEVTGESVWA